MEPLVHIILWLVVLFYPYMKYAGREGGYMMPFSHEINALVFKMSISYFMYFWFFPRKDKIKNIPFLFIALVTCIFQYEFFEKFFHDNKGNMLVYIFTDLLTCTGFAMVFFALYLFKSVYKQQLQIEQLSFEKQQAEIKAIKAQVNPHFLFNTLNTVYVNALRKDDKTPNLILKLSDSFRYLLHEGQNQTVSIKQDVQHLKDYIHLQKERLSKKIIMETSIELDNDLQSIAPLLLITFVENAFKYTSILKGNHHLIVIQIRLQDNLLNFHCQNPYKDFNKHELDETWQSSGIGISSTKKRLELLYPNRYDLEIQKMNNQFSVTLKIQL